MQIARSLGFFEGWPFGSLINVAYLCCAKGNNFNSRNLYDSF